MLLESHRVLESSLSIPCIIVFLPSSLLLLLLPLLPLPLLLLLHLLLLLLLHHLELNQVVSEAREAIRNVMLEDGSIFICSHSRCLYVSFVGPLIRANFHDCTHFPTELEQDF